MYKNPFKSMEPSTTVYKNPLKSKKPPATVANPFRSMEPSTTVAASTDNPYAFLSTFDKIFLIDDSGSMAGRSWRETSKAIASTAPICTAYDEDRIDIYFSNDSSSGEEYKRSQSLKTRQEHSISTGEKKETRKWSKCSTCRQKKIDVSESQGFSWPTRSEADPLQTQCMHQTRDWERKEHDWDYRLGWYQKLLDVETGAAQNAVSAGFAGAKGQTINKIKRGLSGFVNGSRTSAFPDTGAAENVVSVDFAREQQLDIKNNPGRFMLGNSKVTQSIGKKVSFALTASRKRIAN